MKLHPPNVNKRMICLNVCGDSENSQIEKNIEISIILILFNYLN